jgi:putative ATPase
MSPDLFEYGAQQALQGETPLAERMRPSNLDGFLGQEHLVGPGGIVRESLERDRIFSMVLWGPAGCGKTTLARIVARHTRSHFVQFSAVLSGVKEIRSVIAEAREQRQLHRKKTILFVDEIHRFNKAQQDAFLHHVESGLITLIGATTENPSFEIIAPLLSRCRVLVLHPLSREEIARILERAVSDGENGLGESHLHLADDARDHLIRAADGDVRMALNSLEIAAFLARGNEPELEKPVAINLDNVETALQKKSLLYDKSGEEHYNLISALHKSLRGSDPDAALYWLCRMLTAGEDALYIARRMVRFASEDIGNADPRALSVAMDAMEAFRFLGHPEGDLALAQAAVYLATAPKSNAIYTAQKSALSAVREHGSLPVPMHIRNAPTKMMREFGYGDGYRYAHNFNDAYVAQEYLPPELKEQRFYRPADRGFEKEIRRRLDFWRRKMSKPSPPERS